MRYENLPKCSEKCRKCSKWKSLEILRWCKIGLWQFPIASFGTYNIIVAGVTRLILFGSFMSSNTNRHRETIIPPVTCIHLLNLFSCGMLHGVTDFAMSPQVQR